MHQKLFGGWDPPGVTTEELTVLPRPHLLDLLSWDDGREGYNEKAE